jgi:hypothetical protein
MLTALYLITCRSASMTGLYYLPIDLICHEVGLTPEGALEALRSLSEAGFAHYDQGCELVFVPEMARYQVGETIAANDNRLKHILRELETYQKHRFFHDFYERYGRAYKLPDTGNGEAPSKALRRGEASLAPALAPAPAPAQSPAPAPRGGQTAKSTSPKRRAPALSDLPIPDGLNTPEFLKAWNDWLTYKRESKKTLKPMTAVKQLKMLAAWGAVKAVQAIEASITNGWTGLYDPSAKKPSTSGGTNDRRYEFQES